MKECRKERQKRLIEVYEHLRQHFGIHTKTDLAKELKYGRTSFSAAINGKEEYLTDELFEAVCDRYEGVFNLNYLLNGEGELLTPEEDVKSSEIEKAEPIQDSKKEHIVSDPTKSEEELFRLNTPKFESKIKVTGKIDLTALNQSTRPKKKTKEERKKEREDKREKFATAKQGQNGNGSFNKGAKDATVKSNNTPAKTVGEGNPEG